jgi:hypothetical protein
MADTVRNRVRVAGSGFTVFSFMGQPIGFCQQVAHTAPTPVGPGAVAIHPMDEPYPIQVITPAAAGMGSLTLNLYELYNSKVWDRLGQEVGAQAITTLPSNQNSQSLGHSILSGAVDIADIFVRIAEQRPEDLKVVKYIRPPKIAGTPGNPYHEIFHNIVITNVIDGEQIEVGTMEVIKQITVGYTHVTRPGFGVDTRGNPGGGLSKASVLRSSPLV